MNEVWKDVKGYEDHYQVSNKGRVRSLDREYEVKSSNQYSDYKATIPVKGKILKPYSPNENYYPRVLFNANGEKKDVRVHRLVAEAFIPNPGNKREVNHIDGNKRNNHVDNLEWATSSENTAHAWELGLYKAKNHISRAKVSENDVLQIRSVFDQGWATITELSKAYNLCYAAISSMVKRDSWKHL